MEKEYTTPSGISFKTFPVLEINMDTLPAEVRDVIRKHAWCWKDEGDEHYSFYNIENIWENITDEEDMAAIKPNTGFMLNELIKAAEQHGAWIIRLAPAKDEEETVDVDYTHELFDLVMHLGKDWEDDEQVKKAVAALNKAGITVEYEDPV